RFSFYCYAYPRYLHSFPTRRSSDLGRNEIVDFLFEVDTVSGHRQLNLWVCTVYSSNDINQIRSDHWLATGKTYSLNTKPTNGDISQSNHFIRRQHVILFEPA